MPKNVQLTRSDQQQIDEGGGISPETRKDRDTVYECFKEWAANNGNIEDISQAEDIQIEKAVSEFFFTMRVTPKVRIKNNL